jgi:hypothetical protein
MSVSGKRLPLVLPEAWKSIPRRLRIATISAVLLASTLMAAFPAHQVYAAGQITSRTLALQAGASDGGSKPGGVVNHQYNFTVPTSASVGSIQFLYCTTASGTCTLPTGLITTAATMGTQTGATSFTLNNTTNGSPYITRTAAPITGPLALSYQLLSITNPTTTNTPFYVRISTFGSIDTTGSPVDSGVVAASTATQIVLSGTMPESLIFCTGATVGTNVNGIPDCSTASPGILSFNQLFSPADTSTATSQMAASTNAISGYSISVAGPTLTSGSNTIPALSSPANGVHSVSQFGLNLKANTTATSTSAIGTEVAPVPNGTTLRGQAATGYNTVDSFKFVSGDSVAASDNGGAGPTNAQLYTASYIVNVAGGQPAGVYTTTLTYVCTATF